MASSEIIHSITPQKIHTDPVSDKRANTAKNVRNIESKQRTKTTGERKIFRKKISQKKLFQRELFTVSPSNKTPLCASV